MTDEQLIANHLNGDTEAFSLLVGRYETELYRYLVSFTGQPSVAEEAFQEAFLQVHLVAERFEQTRKFRPWLYTIAVNKARDILRARGRRPSVQITSVDDKSSESDLWAHLLREEDTPETLYEQKELRELVHTVIGQMSENLREILLLAYFNQLQYKEIAEVVGVPLGTVKSRLHAAVKLFSKLYMETTSNDRDDSEAPGDLGASGAV
jgi:RNA polymerase sigma-70 factor (ECF subfamily)